MRISYPELYIIAASLKVYEGYECKTIKQQDVNDNPINILHEL